MPDIDRFSEDMLRQNFEIRKYERSERNGVITIKYEILDRYEGARKGALYGAIGAPVRAFAALGVGIIVPALLPAAIPAAITSFLAPAAGAAIGAATGAWVSMEHYFVAATGELCTSRDEAERKARERD